MTYPNPSAAEAVALLVALASHGASAMLDILMFHQEECEHRRMVIEHLRIIGWTEQDLIDQIAGSDG